MAPMTQGQAAGPRDQPDRSATRCGRCSGSTRPLGDGDRAAEAAEVTGLFEKLAADDVVVRGTYDLSGVRADADVMVWWHAADRRAAAGRLQPLPPDRLRSSARAGVEPARDAPAGGVQHSARAGVHGRRGGARPTSASTRSCGPTTGTSCPRRTGGGCWSSTARWAAEYPDVRANTVASFALGDYEWILAFEADELHRIVDLMRHLRASEARLHVREEIPFFTGPRVDPADLVHRLP